MFVLQFRETFIIFTPFMCMFLSKTFSKNVSTLVNRAPLNKSKKKKYFGLVKKVIKMSESVKKRYKDFTI